jgi:hypothetical protein
MRHKVTVYGFTNRHGVTTQDVQNAFTITITRLVTPEDEDNKILQNVSIFQSTRHNIPNDMYLQQCYCRNVKPHNDLHNVQLCSEPLKTALQSIVFTQFVKTLLNQQGKFLLQKTVTAQTTMESLTCYRTCRFITIFTKFLKPSCKCRPSVLLSHTKCSKEKKNCVNCSICYILSLSHSTIFLSTQFSSTLNLCTVTKFHIHIKQEVQLFCYIFSS